MHLISPEELTSTISDRLALDKTMANRIMIG